MSKHSRIILSLTSTFLAYWYRPLLSEAVFPSVDLPSFISLSEQFRQHLLSGRFSFYDPSAFIGWAPLQFYGWLTSFFTVLISLPLGVISEQPVILATHWLMLLGLCGLPWSFYFCSLPLFDLLRQEYRCKNPVLAELLYLCSISCITFWFLNHDKQWFGIGAAAIIHIGLFSQLLAWHLLLGNIGFLLRIDNEISGKQVCTLAILIAALLLTHSLTSIYLCFFALLYALMVPQVRRLLLVAYGLGFALSAFWLLPMIRYLGTQTAFDIIRPKGDFFELVVRYPLYDLLRTLPAGLTGTAYYLQPLNFLLPVLLLFALSQHRRTPKVFLFFFILCLGVLVFSSGFVASSLKMGLHYYRFLGYSFLLTCLMFTVLPLLTTFALGEKRAVYIFFLGYLALSSFITTRLPHPERELLFSHRGGESLRDERAVLDYFRRQNLKGRVYVEHLTNKKRYAPLAAHYISARLYAETGFEAISNSHLQESLPYRFLTGATKSLGAKVYSVPQIFLDKAKLTPDEAIAALRGFGITHVVAGEKKFLDSLRPYASSAIISEGPYSIVPIQTPPHLQIEPIRKRLIGYIDGRGNLPFQFLEYYSFAHPAFSESFEFVELQESLEHLPPVDIILLNRRNAQHIPQLQEKLQKSGLGTKVVDFEYNKQFRLEHYSVNYPHNMELDRYKEVEDFLNRFNLASALRQQQFSLEKRISEEISPPSFRWSANRQAIELQNLLPGNVYRLNYGYNPFWASIDGEVFRGSFERMIVQPMRGSMILTFSRWHVPVCWLGCFMSILAFGALFKIHCSSWVHQKNAEPPQTLSAPG